jgi:hypothetical protein
METLSIQKPQNAGERLKRYCGANKFDWTSLTWELAILAQGKLKAKE